MCSSPAAPPRFVIWAALRQCHDLQPRISIGLDQTRYGRSVHGMRVHLQGSYTPTPPNIGGQITAVVGGETIDHWPTDGHGNIDHWVDVPDRLLQRYTTLDVVLDIAANIGHCGDFYTPGNGNQLLTLNISGDTTVESSPAAPPVPDGMQSVPQALMPRVQVGIEPHSFVDTWRAIQIMVGLQRTSARKNPIDITVTHRAASDRFVKSRNTDFQQYVLANE